MTAKNPVKGDIFYANLDGFEQSVGSEQSGRRPVLIIQNNKGNCYSPTVIAAILTTKFKQNLPTHVVIPPNCGIKNVSVVCLEQIKTIDKSRLGEFVGCVDKKTMKRVDAAISVSLGLKNNEKFIEDKDNIKESKDNKAVTKENKELLNKDVLKNEKKCNEIVETAFNSLNYNWINELKRQKQFFEDIEKYKNNLHIMINNTTNELENILSYIEENDADEKRSAEIYNKIKNKRLKRKNILNEIEKIEKITELFNCDTMSKNYKDIIQSLEKQ